MSAFKRGFDVLLSSFGLIVSSPLWILISILIYFEDHGPVFFVQKRVGRHGRLFRAFKFRSMKPGAELAAPNLQAVENDPRITRVGKILRATAMDELPQLLNILIGEMSFVGPRALLQHEVEVCGAESDTMMDELFEKRCSVTPGLTGLAKVFAPRTIPRKKKFRYDLLYIKKQSFWFDLKLILLSFLITFRGKWESKSNKLGKISNHYV